MAENMGCAFNGCLNLKLALNAFPLCSLAEISIVIVQLKWPKTWGKEYGMCHRCV
ncbi:hypothetical protein Lalb_Chr25g0281661 [Lupinus albus]|uniref:Uncharacterized protein n=1 Tax=Lupinus albus TaxID=3870 RepID=A0A6A4MU55_LUPAL|nr:hypothetical protein Lalb_Chr25g0281661 [Lupinus albus]